MAVLIHIFLLIYEVPEAKQWNICEVKGRAGFRREEGGQQEGMQMRRGVGKGTQDRTESALPGSITLYANSENQFRKTYTSQRMFTVA